MKPFRDLACGWSPRLIAQITRDLEELDEQRDEDCELCGRRARLETDHDHACCPKATCGECIRGRICRNCNIRLAHLEHGHNIKDPDWLAQAERYLTNYQLKRENERELCAV